MLQIFIGKFKFTYPFINKVIWGNNMKKQIILIICTLLIASVLPIVSLPAINSIDEGDVVRPHFEFIVDSECGCNDYNKVYETVTKNQRTMLDNQKS